MPEEASLREIGLSQNEAKVYRAMLEMGESPIDHITRKSGVSRRNVYDTINRLMELGLASQIETGGRRQYEATSPLSLKAMHEEDTHRREDILGSLIPTLMETYRSNAEEIQVRVFKGKKGIKASYEPVFSEKEMAAIGASTEFMENMGFFAEYVAEKRKQLGIVARLIYRDEGKPISKDTELTKNRLLPKGVSPPFTVLVLRKVTNLYLWGEQPIGIQVESQKIAQGFRDYFELLWKISTPPS